jgi:hypothetical protein
VLKKSNWMVLVYRVEYIFQKTKLNAFQSSLRTGTMSTEFLQNKILISGEAVTVFGGEFIL